jgi:hypothetical protein
VGVDGFDMEMEMEMAVLFATRKHGCAQTQREVYILQSWHHSLSARLG